MSKPGDNRADNKLKDLLNRQNGGAQPPEDAFEQEALEGFATLENTEEALELKAGLDARIYPELFSQNKKPGSLRYWYAAAGLLVMVGFSVYFIRNTFNDKEKLAENTVKVEQNKLSEAKPTEPAGAEDKAEELENEPQASAETLKKTKIKAVQKSDDGNALSSKISEAADKENEEVAAAGAGAKTKAVTSQSCYGTTLKTNETALKRAKAEEEKLAKSSNTEDLDEGTKSLGQAASAPAVNVTNIKHVASDSISVMSQKIALAENKGYQREKSQILSEENKQQKADLYRDKKSAAKPEAKISSASDEPILTASECYYTGGHEALKKDLKALLTAQKVDKQFVASITVNTRRIVEKAVIISAGNLTSKEQKKVLEILKSLDRFTLPLSGNADALYEYTFLYKP